MFNTSSLHRYAKNWSYNNTYIGWYIHTYLSDTRIGQEEIQFPSSLTLALNRSVWLTSHLGHFSPGEKSSLPSEQWAGWIPEPFWAFCGSALNYPAHSIVIIPTTLLWLLENLRWYYIQRNYYMEIKWKDDVQYYTYVAEGSTILWKYRDKRNTKKMERWFWSCTSLVLWCIKVTETGRKNKFMFH